MLDQSVTLQATYLGEDIIVGWTPYDFTFSYEITLTIGSYVYKTDRIYPKTTSAYQYRLPTKLGIATSFPSAAELGYQVDLITYRSDEDIVDSFTEYSTIKIPDNKDTKPSATVSVVPLNPDNWDENIRTVFIRGKTTVGVKITNVSAKLNAQIYSIEIEYMGNYYGITEDVTEPEPTDIIPMFGNPVVKAYVTDTRGFTRKIEESVPITAYNTPIIVPADGNKKVICERCNSEGSSKDDGTYIKISAKRSYSKCVIDGEQKNFCSIRYRYAGEGSSYSDWVYLRYGEEKDDDVERVLLGNLNTTKAYTFQIGVIDSTGESSETTVYVPSAMIYMHKAGSMNSLGIGKYVEEPNLIDISSLLSTRFGGKVEFKTENWMNLGLHDLVVQSEEDEGHAQESGCYYLVAAGDKHVYVAFNCSFEIGNHSVQINKEPIPQEYRPKRPIYSFCVVDGATLALVLVNTAGNVFVEWVQTFPACELTTSYLVGWIDGYADYWV